MSTGGTGLRGALGGLLGPVLAPVALVLAFAGCTTPESLLEATSEAPSSSDSAAASGASDPGGPGGPAESVASPPAESPPPAPARLACHRMSYDLALAPTSGRSPVGCAKPHTAQTYHVGRLDTVVNGHLLAVDSDRVQQQVARTCPQRLPGFLGAGSDLVDLTMIRPVWFTPTVEESDAGADWFRCDAVVLHSEGRLARIKGGLEGALANEDGLDLFGMCSQSEPGTKGFAPVLCREPHSWQAVELVDLGDLSEGGYPGEKAVQAAGESPCRAAGEAAASDPLDYEWAYEWPTREQWRSGQHFGRCWTPD